MREIQRDIFMFGDAATIGVQLDDNKVVGVRLIRTKRQKPKRLIEAVDRQIKAGVSLHEQDFNLIALRDLMNALFDTQNEVISGSIAA